jgi:hypothetical protein
MEYIPPGGPDIRLAGKESIRHYRKALLSYPQEPVTGLYPQPIESSPNSQYSSSLRSILVLSSHLCLGLLSSVRLPFRIYDRNCVF